MASIVICPLPSFGIANTTDKIEDEIKIWLERTNPRTTIEDMTDIDPQQQFCDKLTGIADSESIRMLDDNIVMTPVRPVIPSDVHSSHKVSLARVSTYVYRREVGKTTTDEVIAFPTFASHWVIVVTEPDRNRDGHGYHLTFRNEEDARRSSNPKPGSKGVIFTSYLLETIPDGAKEVGRTRFSHSQLMDIGRAMIQGFGSYHRVFWNCQHFARLYLSVITDGKAKFDEWTSAQAANLFLCAFVVTSPVAKTNKMIESHRRRETLDTVGFKNGQVDEDAVLRASDEAIELAQDLARADYERNEVRSESVSKGWSIVETIRRILNLS